MKIAVIGTHCAGKSTLTARIVSGLKSLGIPARLIPELARECPYMLNHRMTVESQRWLWENQLRRETEEELKLSHFARPSVLVSDRSVLDPLIYADYMARFTPQAEAAEFQKFLDARIQPALDHFSTYDLVYWCHPREDDYAPVDDGFRSIDPLFRKNMDDLFRLWIQRDSLAVIPADDYAVDDIRILYQLEVSDAC